MAHFRDAAQSRLAKFKPDHFRGKLGFFRVAQTRSGQWWLIDPHDQPFFSKAVACVNRTGRPNGRSSNPSRYREVVDTRYRESDGDAFVRSVLQRLRAWHFNTLGPGATGDFVDQGMYATELIEFRKAGAHFHFGPALLPDVFDPAWPDAVDALAKEKCERRAESRELVGYFTDQELNWAPLRLVKGTTSSTTLALQRPSLLQLCLSLEPNFPAYHAAWEFVLAPRKGDMSVLAKDWALVLPNKETLRQLTLADTALVSEGYRYDHERFTREFARRYFTVCAAAIRRYDPNHLIFSCYFPEFPGSAVLAACTYPNVDVVSLVCERPQLMEYLKLCDAQGVMPLYLAEFSWVSDSFIRAPAKREPRGLTSVERMIGRGRAALERAFRHPALVGYTWARWVDAEEDQPPFARGLVHLDDSEAREHTELLNDLNTRADELHRTARK